MTNYEDWARNLLIKAAAEKEHDSIYKQCDAEMRLARITGKDVRETAMRTEQRKLQADIDLEMMTKF